MIPVRFTGSSPLVSYILLGLTIFIFLLQAGTEMIMGVDLPAALGMKINTLIMQGQLWRLLTPAFLHGSLLHIAFNMYALHAFGPGLEQYYGHMRFLALYLLAGFTGNVLSFIFSPAASLGSSTSIFGLLGAEGIFLYQNRRLFGNGAQRALSNIVIIAVFNLVIGTSPGIDNWGHVGGLIGGTLFAWFGGPVLAPREAMWEIQLVDRRSASQVWLTWLAVALLFGIFAGLSALLRL